MYPMPQLRIRYAPVVKLVASYGICMTYGNDICYDKASMMSLYNAVTSSI